jgi:hypothetical protein
MPLTGGSSGGFDYGYYTVSRPDANGHGGGDERYHNMWNDIWGSYGSNKHEMKPAFDQIRSAIDAAVEPLLGMADPDNLDSMIDVCGSAEAGFWLDADVGAGGNDLREAFASAKANMLLVSGAFPAAFEANFLNQFPGTIGALRELALVRYAALAQEQQLWRDARASACGLVDDATAAFGKVVGTHDAQVRLFLKIAGYVAAGAAIAVSGGTAVVSVVGFASLGIKILEETAVKDDTSDIIGDSYEEVMAAFTQFCSGLVESVTIAETEIRDNVTDNIEGVLANPATYEISKDSLESSANYADVSIDYAAAREITGTFLPNAAQHVRTIAVSHGRMYPSPALWRSGDIGCGPHGPGTEFADLSTLLYELGAKLALETERATAALQQWIDDIYGLEESIAQQISDFLAQLDAPTPYDS